jgi:hypothetical protein
MKSVRRRHGSRRQNENHDEKKQRIMHLCYDRDYILQCVAFMIGRYGCNGVPFGPKAKTSSSLASRLFNPTPRRPPFGDVGRPDRGGGGGAGTPAGQAAAAVCSRRPHTAHVRPAR